ncbi:MAG: DUF1214 domain-containing protein [Candidatus Nitrosopolaris sp.]|jgi:hypothetical protein
MQKTIELMALAVLALAVVGSTITVQHIFAPSSGPGINSRPPTNIHFIMNADGSGIPLTGANNYKIHFKQTIPPQNWTLTSYDKNGIRYNNTDSFSVKKNTDGSIDIYVQHQSPTKDIKSNWLPSPKDSFGLVLETSRTFPPESFSVPQRS